MAKQTTAVAEAPATEAAAGQRSGLSKVKIIGIIAVIMIVELVAVVLVMPKGAAPAAETAEHAAEGEHDAAAADDHQADAHGEHGSAGKESKGHGKKDEHGASAPAKAGSASEEIDLGEFSVTSFQPASNTTLFISFHLFGTLLHKNSEELQSRLDDNKHRVRDNIIVIVRSAEIADLTDAGLGLIKRRILETSNKTLGKPLLQAVVFSEFSFVEQ